ncbi:MAG TPA: hypothetical protein VHG71_09920 [Verrucomicrobiae bacterium]|nr:hypothetical protein [Verrucomicrobiae bacterium]
MTTPEKYLLATDVVFALLSIWFFFPQCKMRLWQRFFCVAIIWGINIIFFCYDNNNHWVTGHQHYYRSLCLFTALSAFYSWMMTERGRTFRANAENFDRTHQKFLWSIVIVLFLLIPIVVYFILH